MLYFAGMTSTWSANMFVRAQWRQPTTLLFMTSQNSNQTTCKGTCLTCMFKKLIQIALQFPLINLGTPGASTVASQPLDGIPLQWQANPSNLAISPHSRHPSTLNEPVEGKKEGGWVGERGQPLLENRLSRILEKTNCLRRHQTHWD